MKRWSALGVLLPLLTAGCQNWPRTGNMGPGETYLTPGDAAVAEVTSWVETTEAEGPGAHTNDFVDASNAGSVGAPGYAERVTGTLDEAGWSDDIPGPDCAGGQFGPLPEGYYDGDPDAYRAFGITSEMYICVRGEVDTTENIGWDLVLMDVTDGACPKPFTVGEVVPGSNLNRPDAVWGANVPPGVYALLVGAYYPGEPAFDTPYRVGVSFWSPFDGSPEQCPLLDQDSE